MQKDLNEFGADSFEFSVLAVLGKPEPGESVDQALAAGSTSCSPSASTAITIRSGVRETSPLASEAQPCSKCSTTMRWKRK